MAFCKWPVDSRHKVTVMWSNVETGLATPCDVIRMLISIDSAKSNSLRAQIACFNIHYSCIILPLHATHMYANENCRLDIALILKFNFLLMSALQIAFRIIWHLSQFAMHEWIIQQINTPYEDWESIGCISNYFQYHANMSGNICFINLPNTYMWNQH